MGQAQVGVCWPGIKLEKEQRGGGSSAAFSHSASCTPSGAAAPPFIHSNYFPFPFIMINMWGLCWINYWFLLNISINTPPHVSYIHTERFLPPTHNSQTFFLAQYGLKTEPVLRGLVCGWWEEREAEGLVSLMVKWSQWGSW